MAQNHKDTRKKSLFFTGRSASAPEEYFLPKDIFESGTFQNQLTRSIFDPQALPLKKAVSNILINIKSEENLEFIEKIYAINTHKQVTPLEIHNRLEDIEDKYITADALTLLNIEPTVLNKILKDGKSSRRLHDYSRAIKDIFELIRNNIDTYLHVKPERKASLELIDASVFFAQSLNTIIHIETVKLGILKTFTSSNRDTVLFAECQKVCRNAQQKTFALLAEYRPESTGDFKSESTTVFKNKLTKILFEVKQALESRIGALQKAELHNNFGAIKANTINNILDSIGRVITRLNLTDAAVKKPRSNQVVPLNEAPTKSNRPK